MCYVERIIDEMPSVLVNSNPIVSDMIAENFAVDKRRVFTVLDAVDTSIVKPIHKDSSYLQTLRRKIGIPKDDIVVIYVGSFSELQGTDILLKSIFNVVERNRNISFLLVGGKWNSGYYKSIKDSARKLDIKKKTRFIPSVDYFRELPAYLSLADVAVAPKRQSLQSHGKLAAYMAAGLPTVVFDIPINRVFLGELGIYQKDFDSESLADSILFAIRRYAKDVALKNKLRLRATALFSLKRMADDLEKVYSEAALV
jgi:glycosyltransferase involved in cell wall biosynthesis